MKTIEEKYKEYIEKNNLEDILEEKAEFFLDSGEVYLKQAIELYKEMGRDVDKISDWKLYLNPNRLTFEEFCEDVKGYIKSFEHDYGKIEGGKEHWPEHWLEKFNDYFLD